MVGSCRGAVVVVALLLLLYTWHARGVLWLLWRAFDRRRPGDDVLEQHEGVHIILIEGHRIHRGETVRFENLDT